MIRAQAQTLNSCRTLVPFLRGFLTWHRLLLSAPGIWLATLSQPASAATCIVSQVVTPVFASYQTATGSATGSIGVRCTTLITETVSFSIRLGYGGQAVGTQRRMAFAGQFLNYNFFCGNDYAQIWGDGLGGTCAPTGGGSVPAAFPLTSTFTVYGRIPGGQYVGAGTYLDTIMITVLY
jgi:spore coat protein U-like protein